MDTQLIGDGTYFVIESDCAVLGCGGWSRRATLYGGDRSPGRDAALFDAAKDRARCTLTSTTGRRPSLRCDLRKRLGCAAASVFGAEMDSQEAAAVKRPE